MLGEILFHLTIGLLAVVITQIAKRACPTKRHTICVCSVLMVAEAIVTVQLVG